MSSQILKAADEVIAQLTLLSADQTPGSTWSSEVISAFGDWAATNPPEISYDSVIDRKDLPKDALAVYVGFGFRELYDNARSRCEQVHSYPIAVGVYQRFRAPGVEAASGSSSPVSRSSIDNHLKFVEELQSNMYSSGLTSFVTHSSAEAEFDHETISKQYLRSIIVLRYTEKQ
jgi:hypothetical protein